MKKLILLVLLISLMACSRYDYHVTAAANSMQSSRQAYHLHKARSLVDFDTVQHGTPESSFSMPLGGFTTSYR